MDDRYMVAHQRLDELDFLWLLWVLHQNSKETLDRVYLKISSLFLRVDTCTVFWLWCNEIFEKYFPISEFATSIFLHRDFEFSISSSTFTRLHREPDEIIPRFEWCSEFCLDLGLSDVVYCDSCHRDIIYDYAENQILFFHPYFPYSLFSKNIDFPVSLRMATLLPCYADSSRSANRMTVISALDSIALKSLSWVMKNRHPARIAVA